MSTHNFLVEVQWGALAVSMFNKHWCNGTPRSRGPASARASVALCSVLLSLQLRSQKRPSTAPSPVMRCAASTGLHDDRLARNGSLLRRRPHRWFQSLVCELRGLALCEPDESGTLLAERRTKNAMHGCVPVGSELGYSNLGSRPNACERECCLDRAQLRLSRRAFFAVDGKQRTRRRLLSSLCMPCSTRVLPRWQLDRPTCQL